MNTTKRRMLLCGLLLILLEFALPAHAFYDPSLGRWLNRDPLGEPGFETVRRPLRIRMHDGVNLYAFVRNNPGNLLDPLGLAIWVCNRDVSGFPFVGNHSYLWDDKGKEPCGMNASSGNGPRGRPRTDTGPGTPGQDCTKVGGSDGKEDDVMKYSNENANNGMWFPGLNDCHNAVDDCLKSNGLKPPKHPRFDDAPGPKYPGDWGNTDCNGYACPL